MAIIKFHGTTPDKRNVSKSFSLDRYTEAEAKYMGKLWLDWVTDGCKGEWQKPSIVAVQKALKENNETIQKKKEEASSTPAIEEYDINTLQPPFENGGASFLLIGSTRSGKTFAMKWIYEKYYKKHITILMTLSKQNEIYKELKKNTIITDGFQKQFVEEAMRINRFTENRYDFCLIFDDLSMEGKHNEHMTKLLTIGRNSNMNAIICGQKMTMLSATGRTNCNYVFLFYQNTESAIEDTIKTYLRSYMPRHMSMVDLIAMYKEMTADHHFFFINALEDKCYHCKIKG
jgi:hypothetical protein